MGKSFRFLTSVALAAALPILTYAQGPVAGISRSATLEFDLPEGAVLMVQGKEYAQTRRLRYDNLKPKMLYQVTAIVRTKSGGQIERTIRFSAGDSVRESFVKPDGSRGVGTGAGETLAAETTKRVQRWALLVGINDYVELEKLRFCSHDMKLLRQHLVAGGFPEDQVVLLNDQSEDRKLLPIKANIERQLDLILGLAEKDDLVLVAFSGHGMFIDGVSYLCPTEARVDQAEQTMISVDEIYAKMKNCRAALKLLVVDACRNDPRPAGRRSATPKEDSTQLVSAFERPPDGTLILASCAPGQISWEDENLSHGVFMHYLLQGLEGNADSNHNGRISLGELYEFSTLATKKHVAKKWIDFQTPQLFGQLNGVFEFETAVRKAKSSGPKVDGSTARFDGTWAGTNGQMFYFKLRVTVKGTVAEGEFFWTLAVAPPGSALARKIGQSGTEFVKGTYDPARRMYDLEGYRLSVANLLATDRYRMILSPDGDSISGNTRGNAGEWASVISGKRAK